MAIKLDQYGSQLTLKSDGYDRILNGEKMERLLLKIGNEETQGLKTIYRGSTPSASSVLLDSAYATTREVVSSKSAGLTRIPERKVFRYKVEIPDGSYKKPVITGLRVWRFQK